jgi:site-specific recombinase XerD
VNQATLQAILETIQPSQQWLFPGRSNGHLSTKTVLRTIERLGEEAGLQEVSGKQKLSRSKVTPHILRHSHVVNAFISGALKRIYELLNEAQEKTARHLN